MTECRPLHLALISGLSGAGKSEAVATFEDSGYFCIDNLPPQMLPGAIDLFGLEGSRIERVALVFDVRGGTYFEHIDEALEYLRQSEIPFQLLFLEADDEVLVNRFQSTRRPHPLSRSSLLEGIKRERRVLSGLRAQADLVVDTSELSPRALRRTIEETLLAEELSSQLFLSLVSFGYKNGIPDDADMIIDVRFLPNPHWVEQLRPLSGRDAAVRDYVLERDDAKEFLAQLEAMVRFVAPRFVAEQKRRLVLAIGCTGGRHRSVSLVHGLAARLRDDPGLVLSVSHRDLDEGC